MSDMILRTSFGQTAQFRRATATMGRPAWTPFALFNAGQAGEWRDANPARNFSDTGGTAAVLPGQVVARTNDVRGAVFGHDLQATLALRPTFGRGPRGGIRNFATAAAVASGYQLPGTFNGVTRSIVGEGFIGDEYYIDVLCVGTPTAAINTFGYFTVNSRFPVASGQTVTASARFSVIAGDTAQVTSVRIGAVEETAPNTAVGVTNAPATAISTTEQLVQATRTITTGNQARVGGPEVNFPVGTPINVTIRLRGLQIEIGAARGAYQANRGLFDVTEAGVPDNYYRQGTLGGKLMNSSAALDLSGQDVVSFWVVAEKLSDADPFTVMAHGGHTEAGSVRIGKAGSFAQWSAFYRDTGGDVTITRTGAPAPDRAVLSGLVSRTSGGLMRLFYDGVEVPPVAGALSAPFRNAIVSRFARPDGSNPFTGRIYEDGIRGGAFTDQQFALLNSYLMAEYGVTA